MSFTTEHLADRIVDAISDIAVLDRSEFRDKMLLVNLSRPFTPAELADIVRSFKEYEFGEGKIVFVPCDIHAAALSKSEMITQLERLILRLQNSKEPHSNQI
jgi:hypothetical protein